MNFGCLIRKESLIIITIKDPSWVHLKFLEDILGFGAKGGCFLGSQ